MLTDSAVWHICSNPSSPITCDQDDKTNANRFHQFPSQQKKAPDGASYISQFLASVKSTWQQVTRMGGFIPLRV